MFGFLRWSLGSSRFLWIWFYLHQLKHSLDLTGGDLDASLSTTPALVVFDRDLLPADLKLSRIRLAKPVVQCQYTDPQALGRVGGRQQGC